MMHERLKSFDKSHDNGKIIAKGAQLIWLPSHIFKWYKLEWFRSRIKSNKIIMLFWYKNRFLNGDFW